MGYKLYIQRGVRLVSNSICNIKVRNVDCGRYKDPTAGRIGSNGGTSVGLNQSIVAPLAISGTTLLGRSSMVPRWLPVCDQNNTIFPDLMYFHVKHTHVC